PGAALGAAPRLRLRPAHRPGRLVLRTLDDHPDLLGARLVLAHARDRLETLAQLTAQRLLLALGRLAACGELLLVAPELVETSLGRLDEPAQLGPLGAHLLLARVRALVASLRVGEQGAGLVLDALDVLLGLRARHGGLAPGEEHEDEGHEAGEEQRDDEARLRHLSSSTVRVRPTCSAPTAQSTSGASGCHASASSAAIASRTRRVTRPGGYPLRASIAIARR